MIWFFVVFTFFILIIRIYKGKYPKASSNDGAIIMAVGILINGAIQKIPPLASSIGPYMTVGLLSLLLWLVAEYIRDGIDGSFVQRHLSNPIQSFGLGTWVAALSVTTVSLTIELPALRSLAVSLFLAAILVACAYLFLIVRNFYQITKGSAPIRKVKGVILLSCVAYQSLVIAGSNLYPKSFPKTASLFLIGLGLIFYTIGIVILIYRYKDEHLAAIDENWPNTNTLIHGAVSITGLAIISSPLNIPNVSAVIWLASIILIITIEGTEITRALIRLKNHGVKSALLVYQPSQWSRIFTLGMFLAFTIKLPLQTGFLKDASWAAFLKQAILDLGPYLPLALLVIEILLALPALFSRQEAKGEDKLSIR